jgi:integrase
MVAYVVKGRKRSNGKRGPYRGRYRIGDGPLQDVSLDTTDKQVAERKLRQLVKEAQQEAAGIIAPREQREAAEKPYSDHVNDFVAHLKGLRRTPHHQVAVRNFLSRPARECGWCRIGDVTAVSFENWRAGQGELSAKTLNEYLAALQHFFGWLCDCRCIGRSPLQGVAKLATRGRETRKRRAYTDEEARKLLSVSGARMPVYLLAVNTGLRQKEIRCLQWGDITLDSECPHLVTRSSTTKNGKEAVIALRPEVVRVLRDLKPDNCRDSDPVFASVPRARELRQDLKRAGIPYQDDQGRYADFHALRYTFITNLGRSGVPERVRMEAARHSDPRLTACVYTDASKLATRAALLSLPDLLCSHIGSHETDAGGHSVSQAGTNSREKGKSQNPAEKQERHEQSQNDASCLSNKNGSGLTATLASPTPIGLSANGNGKRIPREKGWGPSLGVRLRVGISPFHARKGSHFFSAPRHRGLFLYSPRSRGLFRFRERKSRSVKGICDSGDEMRATNGGRIGTLFARPSRVYPRLGTDVSRPDSQSTLRFYGPENSILGSLPPKKSAARPIPPIPPAVWLTLASDTPASPRRRSPRRTSASCSP